MLFKEETFLITYSDTPGFQWTGHVAQHLGPANLLHITTGFGTG